MFAALKALLTRPSSAPSGATSISYPSFPSVPVGTLNVPMTVGAGNVLVSGTTLQEGARASGSSTQLDSAAVLPDVMATNKFSVTVTVGALSSAATNRAVGAGCFSADGTKGVYITCAAQSASVQIRSYVGGTITAQGTAAAITANSAATITLQPSVSGGVVTWTVLINGVATACTWTDSSHVVDLPGTHPAACFRHNYSGGNFPSRGISALSAAVIP